MSLSSIKNYLQVSQNIASSGQPDKDQFRYIADAEYGVVINLAMSDSNNAILEEGNIVTSLGMSYVHIPVPFESPQMSQLKTFFKTMQSIDNEKVWVHCVLNYRVSAFLYLYKKLVEGVTDSEAREAILPTWQADEIWSAFMETAAQSYIK